MNSPDNQNEEAASSGVFLKASALLVVAFAMSMAFRKATGGPGYALGAAIGQLFIIALVVALFSIFKRFRTPDARLRVVILASSCALVASLVSPGHEQTPNKAPDPKPTSVTSPAAQETRQP